jgi:hypothetical protein
MVDLATNWERLDAASFRFTILRTLRRNGWASAAVGAVCLVAGLAPPFTPALVAVGSILAAAGTWNVLRPSPPGLIVDGLSIIATGLVGATSLLWSGPHHVRDATRWTIVGLFQIAWGVRRLALYPAARYAMADAATLAQLEEIARDLAKRRPKTDPGVIEFSTGWYRRTRHRLGLFPEGAVALLENRQALRFERRQDVEITLHRKAWIGRSVGVSVRMSDLTLKGEMPEEHYERFESWKLGLIRPPAFAA